MKLILAAALALTSSLVVDAFSVFQQPANLFKRASTSTLSRSAFAGIPSHNARGVSASSFQLNMESDFGTAMPDKPEMSFNEKMADAATQFIVDIESRLAEGVSAPPELEDLRKARDSNADGQELALKIYILLIEQGMLYDSDPDTGLLALTNFNIKEGLEIPEVKQEFAYLYKYGMGLISKGVVDIDTIKEVVKERLIDRTGLSPEEFDKWLGYE